ncbi:MAG: 2-C-methyl-D-erythritol 4-phosphate cytidylyltransferase [Propionibacteriaceae bacterium]|jgi:2-C-methyl-D-erythritol 4-phosphate cytidylyltransferase|nr:2-C-methyl-D-erythritol 4-phosphate cytidylyltransferase [Propionibacteriaceae bacterium]
MSTAIIIAGGSGERMGADIPKQFLLVNGKPVVIYTLEAFQAHPYIDSIGIVCIDGWQELLRSYLNQYEITKVDWIIPGGASAQESIRNGVSHLKDRCPADEIVVIHDGIRPLVEQAVISDVIATCTTYGNGVAALPYNEQIFRIDPEEPYSTVEYIPRDTLRRVATPQAYRYDVLEQRYQEAFDKGIGIGPSSYTNTMMVDLGERLYFATGSDKNIKLTTRDDLMLFQALLAEVAEPVAVLGRGQR